jgi:hypothetical protein
VTRAVWAFYLASLVLLPWGWFPRFPWLHEHAQWSDAIFAATALLWLLERLKSGTWPKVRAVHGAMVFYLGWALLSHMAAGFEPHAGSWKLLGMAELAALATITGDLASRPEGPRRVALAVAATSLATAAAALAGVLLFHAGLATPLVSHHGDLVPGHYARARAGLPLPNLLASYCIFALGAVSLARASLPRSLRRLTQGALALTVTLTMARGILGFVAAALFGLATTPRRARLAWVWVTFTALVLFALTAWNLVLDPTHPTRIHLRNEPSSRWATMVSSSETAVGSPLFGHGPGSLPGMRSGWRYDAHFTPLNIAATLGTPAALAFLAIPALLWRGRQRPTNWVLWGALVGIGLDALAQDVEDFRHVWVLFGLAAADARQPSDERRPV